MNIFTTIRVRVTHTPMQYTMRNALKQHPTPSLRDKCPKLSHSKAHAVRMNMHKVKAPRRRRSPDDGKRSPQWDPDIAKAAAAAEADAEVAAEEDVAGCAAAPVSPVDADGAAARQRTQFFQQRQEAWLHSHGIKQSMLNT